MVFPVLVMREHSPAAFLWVLFWDLTRVYLFENKICDSVMILMCSFVWFEQLGLRNDCNYKLISLFNQILYLYVTIMS